MWKIVKTELAYYRIPYILFFIINLVPCFIDKYLYKQLESFFTILTLIILLYFRFRMVSEWSRTARLRFLSGLPLPSRNLEIVRHVGFIIFWLIWAISFSITSIVSQWGHIGPDYLYWMLTKLGSILIFTGGLYLGRNIIYWRKSGSLTRILLWIAGGFFTMTGSILGLFLYVFTIPGPASYDKWFYIYMSEMFLTLPGSLSLLHAGALMIILDVYIFGNRRTYIEEAGWLLTRS